MKKFPYLLVVLFFMLSCAQQEKPATATDENNPQRLSWVDQVGAKSFPAGTKVFKVNEYGAVNDGKTLNTVAIQTAIDACAADGGGIVVFAPGEYLTGSLFVKNGVNLRIDEGVTLLGSQHIRDYPDIETRVAGIEMVWPAALINVIDQENAAVTGKGTIHAQGKPFWDLYWTTRKEYEQKGLRWIVDYDVKRPRTLLVSGSSNISLKDLTMKQAGFWTVHILYSENITADGLVIRNNVDGHGPSTDGIDIDSSSYILVENCDIDCNDDNFCLKSGRDADGLRVNRPTEYVVIRNSISRQGGGLITFGSETSGGIRHILAHDLQAEGTGVGLRFKSALTRGGTVEDIHLRNITMKKVRVAIEVAMSWNPSYSYSALPEGYNIETVPAHWKVMLEKVEPEEKGIPEFKNIHISDINVTQAEEAIVALGVEKSWIKDFHLEDVVINTKSAGRIEYAKDWTFKSVHLKADDRSTVQVVNAENMQL
jgi:polygalacturonase